MRIVAGCAVLLYACVLSHSVLMIIAAFAVWFILQLVLCSLSTVVVIVVALFVLVPCAV